MRTSLESERGSADGRETQSGTFRPRRGSVMVDVETSIHVVQEIVAESHSMRDLIKTMDLLERPSKGRNETT